MLTGFHIETIKSGINMKINQLFRSAREMKRKIISTQNDKRKIDELLII